MIEDFLVPSRDWISREATAEWDDEPRKRQEPAEQYTAFGRFVSIRLGPPAVLVLFISFRREYDLE